LETRVPQGETLDEVVSRVNKLVKEIVAKHAAQQMSVAGRQTSDVREKTAKPVQIIMVSHGGPIRAIIGTVLGMDLNQYWRLRLDNGCLSIIDFPALDKGIMALLNDCSHLEGC